MANWEGVNEFVAVVETGSFTHAAKKLATSVVQVSRKVATLESRLAVKLLYRTTRKVSSTEAGHVFYEQCRHLIEGLELAEHAVMQMQSTPKGALKVTAPATFGETYISPLVNAFLQQHEQVEIDLILTNEQLNLVENGIDVAVRLGHLKSSTLKAKPLGSRQLRVCASPSYLSRFSEPTTLSTLSKHICLTGTNEYWNFKENGKARALKVSGRLSCNSGATLLAAAKQGLGLVQLPDYYLNSALQSGELKEVLQAYRCDKEGIWALYPQASNVSLKVRLFIDFLAENLNVGQPYV
ncbi:LysR family transcriptional regulator [Alteromonas sp. a30]|uniref:LysR family transcriptional regulator n=1 Tax=Alteromonas sp. a30 TaxID=2730917 RepID=UPI002282ACB6|nr:LysR family transcriptional regulator [Alteromonas sp. a30]MCY7296449.1 LysR family transcriptional regulator [Alteromonas sp. a30]